MIVLMALVLSLDSADAGAIGGMATPLQGSLGIDSTKLGLLFTVESVVAAAGTIVFGWLVDRRARTRLLALTIVLWGVAMVACGAATSYAGLLAAQVALGAVIAAAQPAVASLVGDYSPPDLRGRVFGFILSGELIGTAIGVIAAGLLAEISWRLGFWALALPTPLLAWAIHRLPEPARGGASWLQPGQERIEARPGAAASRDEGPWPRPAQSVGARARAAGVEPRERLVRDVDPRKRSFVWGLGYVLRIPTNLVLIISSALGYYFFGGLRIFSIELLTGRYHLSHQAALGVAAIVGSGAVLGVYAGGKGVDGLLARGHDTARIWVASCAYLASAALFLLGLLSVALATALILYFLAAFALAAANPPLDAARLDIVPSHLWGRAEGVRMTVRKAAEAAAPVVFGYVAEDVFGGGPSPLRATFSVMLISLFGSGLISLIALRTYRRDAASADALTERARGRGRR
ncbi:MFS transporter [Sorangium sp. So ce124]|uniref:MFS transporter n=1 Tax=Sorangium sp. So ce124 TaxID=3133280 RepID=UPI003F6139C9